jgi:transcriptional regulator with XRE-family HTH domain
MDMAEAAVQEDPDVEEGKGLDAVSVGKVLKEARNQAGLTRAQVEAKTGIGRNRLYRLERGLFTMKLDEMYALCSLYHLPHSAVMAGYAEEVGGQDGDQAEDEAEGDPVSEAREHLQQAASLLGLRVVPEREASEAVGPGIKVDPGEAVSLEAQLDNLAAATGGKPDRVKTSKLNRQIADVLEATTEAEVAELIDVADHRGIDVDAFEEASEDEDGWLEPDGIRGLDQNTLHQTLARLVVVHAVYGVDPFSLSLDRVKRLNLALAEALPDQADDWDDGVVTHGRKITEMLDSDRSVRNRMARELLPHLLEAAKAGRAPVKAMKAEAGGNSRKR